MSSDPLTTPAARPGAPSHDAIRAQVDRITGSEVFRRAERQCRFLRYIVDQSLRGNTDRLKGYTVAIDVFDRAPDFDPNLDSIVRVEAGRLRSKLRDYYLEAGGADPVHIELPRGTYAPVISEYAAGALAPSMSGAPRSAPANSVAVLPFRNVSGDPSQVYFSDGLTDAVVTALARNSRLKVISLTSVMRFKNTQRSIPEIAEELNVTHVLEGTVLREGDRVRVTAQLIEAGTDHHCWADSFERQGTSMIRMHGELADIISAHLLGKLAPQSVGEATSVDPAAYDLYLLGRSYRRKLTREGLDKATECFRQAIRLDDGFAAAYAGAASCYCALGSYGFELEKPERLIPTGLEYSRRAMELDPGQVESITFTAIMTLKYEWDWAEAERLFRRALAVSPNDARTRVQFSLYYESIGDHARATEEAKQARRIDPLSVEANMNLAWQLHQAGREHEALSRFLWTLDLNAGFWGGHWGLGHVYLSMGRYDDAIVEFQRSVECKGGHATPLQGLGYACAASGDRLRAQEVLSRLDSLAAAGYVSPCCYAAIYAGLEEADRCFEYLEKAFKLHARSLAWIKVAREYAGLRSDPRFADLGRRIGIP